MRALFVVVFAVLLALHAAPSLADGVKLRGIGGALPNIMFSEWIFAYSVTKPSVTIDYTPRGSSHGVNAIIRNTYDFGSSDPPLEPSELAEIHPAGDVIEFPAAAVPVALLVNLPALTAAGLQVTLDRLTVARIFSRNITSWADPAILATNPPSMWNKLPDMPIQVIARTQPSGTTNILTSCLSSFAPPGSDYAWPYGVIDIFPPAYLNAPNTWAAANNFGVPGAVLLVNNSISFVTYPNIGSSLGAVTQAVMINRHNDTVTDPVNGTELAIQNADPFNYTESLIDSPLPYAWPIAGWTYVFIRKTNYSAASCATRRELLLFWNWVLTSNDAQNRMPFQGYSPIGPALTAKVLEDLKAAVCVEAPSLSALRELALDQHTKPQGFKTLLVLAMIALGVAVVMELSYFFIERRGLLKAGKYQRARMSFYVMVSSGTIFNYASIIFFYLTPDADWICQLRLWLPCLGFSLLLGAMFVRGLQVQLLWRMEQPGSQIIRLRTANHSTIVYLTMFTIAGLQAILLVVWTAVDPFSTTHTQIDPLNRTFTYLCASDSTWVWWGLEISFVFLLVVFGMVVIYMTWDIKSKISEWKWVSTAIYNVALVVVIMICIFASVDEDDDFVFWVCAPCILLLNTVTLAVFFAPRIYREFIRKLLRPSSTTSRDSNTEDGPSEAARTYTGTAGLHGSPKHALTNLNYGASGPARLEQE